MNQVREGQVDVRVGHAQVPRVIGGKDHVRERGARRAQAEEAVSGEGTEADGGAKEEDGEDAEGERLIEQTVRDLI